LCQTKNFFFITTKHLKLTNSIHQGWPNLPHIRATSQKHRFL